MTWLGKGHACGMGTEKPAGLVAGRADFGEEIERRASDAKLILETAAKYGVPVDMLWKPTGAVVTPQPTGK
jgi:hypothetical protein